jgi:acid phosphatase
MRFPSGSKRRCVVAALTVAAACTAGRTPGAAPTASVVGTASSTSPSPTSPAAPHVFVIVLENHSYSQLIGSSQAPYLTSLAHRYATATNYRAVSHPSLPNYLALTAGSTFGVTTDCTTCSVDATHLGDQMEARGLSWKTYLEDMPAPCYSGSSYREYAKKHNPFMYYRDVSGNAQRCAAHVVPLGVFSTDSASGRLPLFSLIVPNGCHDMHDCSVATGDAWLRGFVPTIMRTPAYASGGIIVITVDEENSSSINHVVAVVVSNRVPAETTSGATLTHYSLLRSIEHVYGLAYLGHAGDADTGNLFAALGAS